MAPTPGNKGDAAKASEITANEGNMKKSSAGPVKGKSISKGGQHAPSKTQKLAVGKKPAPRRMSKKRKEELSKNYRKFLKTRQLFGDGADEDVSKIRSMDAEHYKAIENYMDSRPQTESELAKGDQDAIAHATKKCHEWLHPDSPRNGPYIVQGITSHLTPIQFATLGWMVGKETPNSAIKGGIVAHDMGLGKTLMALALMVIKGTSLDRKRANDCPTLVVVPSYAVVDHWQEECLKHAPDFFDSDSLGIYKELKSLKSVDGFKAYKVV